MVIHRSDVSRSRTGIHGGLRRGAAAAAVGAVLVLSAGVPASRAADGSTNPTEPAQVAADLSGATGLLKGLNDSGRHAVTASPAPSPSTASTAAPTTTQSPATAPTSTAPASSAPTPAPAAQGALPQGSLPPSSAAPATTFPAPGTDGAGAQPGQPVPPAAPQEAGQNAVQEDAGEEDGTTANQPTPHSSGATPVSGPKRTAEAPASQQNAAAAAEAEPMAETAKVLLGVGLVGSGAAGLLFARIRNI